MKNEQIIAEIDLDGCPEGAVLQPLEYQDELKDRHFKGWETPLAPWGGFGLNSGLTVVQDGSRPALEWIFNNADRAIVSGLSDMRDYKVTAEIKQIDAIATPSDDRADCTEALIGIVFRIKTSRHYYHFGIEGRQKAVLYKRADDKWFVLAKQDINLKDDYVTLVVELDSDSIRCKCDDLGVNFFYTDTAYPEGKAGIRGIGKARLASLRITQNSLQKSLYNFRSKFREEKLELGKNIPDPKLATVLNLSEIGGYPQFNDFIKLDRYDMLIAGKTLRAMTAEKELIWETPIKLDGIVFSAQHSEEGRLIYGFTGERWIKVGTGITGAVDRAVVSDEMVVLRGIDGEILARTKLPELDKAVRMAAFTTSTGNLTGGGKYDIVLREWRSDCGNGGINLWAYDRELNLLWCNKSDPPYGHGYAVQFYDVDGDGRDEFLAGGTLFDPNGNVIWVHDLAYEMAKIPGAHHYDAVAIGDFCQDDSLTEKANPMAFLLGGSAGVYVVDALSGQTRMAHRVGHAQGRLIGKVRKDFPGQQILVACRWGNMGILNLFSGYGDRLWTIQPDYMGQGSCPVTWGDPEEQLIWMNTTGQVQSLYDGHGRRVKILHELRDLWENRMRKDVSTFVTRMGTDPTELICIAFDGKIYAFKPIL